ncbi:hypothetical protein M422DRAFT_56233 [Sphaerobolus stellatus SS14]|uniref:Uncharacterized protein n=1 Tax=Sphaerobolus stellatus (strain SS14) TaxID=990650 RepID=A0A0C9TSP6_SPHS4|nr:hypothetical protein M422DRAFT_56233 [Sphaerobolus stellatus SS14]
MEAVIDVWARKTYNWTEDVEEEPGSQEPSYIPEKVYISLLRNILDYYQGEYTSSDIVHVIVVESHEGLVSGFSWHLYLPTSPHCSTKYPQASEIYIFVPPQDIHNTTLEMYWSVNPTGAEKLMASDMSSFGLMEDSLLVMRKMILCSVPEDQFNLVCKIHENLGIDQTSNDTACMFSFPLYTFPDELGESGEFITRDRASN